MQDYFETGALEPVGCALGQQAVLEAAAGQRYTWLAHAASDRNDGVDQGVVEARRDDALLNPCA